MIAPAAPTQSATLGLAAIKGARTSVRAPNTAMTAGMMIPRYLDMVSPLLPGQSSRKLVQTRQPVGARDVHIGIQDVSEIPDQGGDVCPRPRGQGEDDLH